MAAKISPDPKGYYRILRVSPEATHDEIRLAHAMAMQGVSGPHLRRMEQAYGILKSPKSRAAYDKERLRRERPFFSPRTLLIAVAVLVVVFLWLWLPGIRMHGKTFRAGQSLVEIRTGRQFGQVMKYESHHSFPEGMNGPGYLVKVGTGDQERWFPAIDLQATCNAH